MATYLSLCQTIQAIRQTRGTNAKISICSEYLSTLENERDLNLAAQFLGEGAFSNVSGKRASVGSRTAGLAACEFCEIDYDNVFKPCRTATGSNSETIGRLMENIPEALAKWSPEGLTLSEAQGYFEQLFEASSRADKQNALIDFWKKSTPLEMTYSIRMLGQSSLRIGFEIRSLIAAISKAFSVDKEEVRYAHMITGSVGKTAVLAKQNRLHEARFKLFHPLSFMLASPIESRSVTDLNEYVAEEKFDGMRAQVHSSTDGFKVFSRDLNDITSSFPDIEKFFEQRATPAIVLDGEICVYKNDKIMPFQHLQKRMGIKKPSKKIIEEYPVLFVAYDLLYIDESPTFSKPLRDRRIDLKNLAEKHHIPITTQFDISDLEDVETLYQRALKHGNEGLMLKKSDSVYEYGQRGKSWLKVKKPGGSFDTVIMYAHSGSGKRGGLYSDFTLGISVKNDERYEEEFIPIGKAYGGYSDEELKMLNLKIKELTVEKYGPTLGLKPGIIVEIEFDGIQENRRTKAGYTLRFPRFKRIRWDLAPDDVDTLSDVEKLFTDKLAQPQLEQKGNPSFRF